MTKFDQFAASNPAAATWLKNKSPKSSFAASLLDQVNRKGTLSERQMDAILTSIRKDLEEAERMATAPVIDLSKLEAIFNTAKERGVSRPMIRLGIYKFKVANAFGNNAGAIWVTMAEKDETGEAIYMGKIAGGKFIPARNCPLEDADDIAKVAADPMGAAKAYGKRTGMCCACGRTLTAADSIDRFMGPICFSRFF